MVGVESGLLEQCLVVEDDDGVRLPGHLVEVALRVLVLVGDGAAARFDVCRPTRELRQVDEAPLFLELTYRGRRGVVDQARRIARGDRRTDDLFAGLTGRDLLAGDLLVWMGLVPGRDDLFAPGNFLRVVGVPDLDRTLGRQCARTGAAAGGAAREQECSGCEGRRAKYNSPAHSVAPHRVG